MSASRPDREVRARSFGAVAQEYERGRPGYPLAAIKWLLGNKPLEVLDLGAGTGKLTRTLVQLGHRVIAIEPLAEMRALLAQNLPGVLVLDATAEAIPIADASVDAVLAGAAFHWFDHERALAQAKRVLRPPGILGLLGNRFDSSPEWVAHLRELLGPAALDTPGHWPAAGQLAEYFSVIEDHQFDHEQRIDPAGLRDLAQSRSAVATLPAAQIQALLARLDRLWLGEPELIGRPSAILPWHTRVRRCQGLRGQSP